MVRTSRIFLIALLQIAFSLEFVHAAERSSLCVENGIAFLEFTGISAVQTKGDVCLLPSAQVSEPVTKLIREMGRIHRELAKVIGQSESETIGSGFKVSFMGSNEGSISSYALMDGSGVILKVLPTWSLREWPAQTYAHELTHVLNFRKGEFAKASFGLEEHPFITEALPDLISMTVHRDPVVKLEGEDLPKCLRVSRDATPTHSLNQTFGDYYTFAASDRLLACCASLTAKEKTPVALQLCGYVKEHSGEGYYPGMKALGANLKKPTAADLRAPFRVEQCLFQIKGWDMLQGCGTHGFAESLGSFFFALEKEFSRPFVTRWIQLLKNQSTSSKQLQCDYVNAGVNRKSVPVVLRGVSPSLRALREDLLPGEQKSFDRIWSEHGFEQLEKLDALYMGRSREGRALNALSGVNTNFSNQYRCGSVYAFDAKVCAVECR